MTTETAERRVQVVELRLADHEQVAALIHGVSHAVSLLASLTDDERAALPAPAQSAVDALFAACRGLDAEPPPNLEPRGSVILEWAPRRGDACVMPGWQTSVFDAMTGKPIYTASKIRIVDADASRPVMADLTQLADPEGNPVPDDGGKVYPDEDGKIRTGVFRYYVAEMRVRP